MYTILTIVLLIFVVLVLYNNIALLRFVQRDLVHQLIRFDNTDVPLIEPPTEIVIEGNEHECHKQLTPCATHLDCDVCREGLANCQYFDDKTIITITDTETQEEKKFTIEPGESYCLALDRERARSCNPHTGVWILAESEVGYSLLCSCLAPGLVSQLSLYNDCDVPVGCQPHGQIVSMFETPMRCSCEVGFVADFDDATQTPFCRPRRIRDVIRNPDFFPQAPCEKGYVPIDHPALNPEYLNITIARDICVIDPCSVDPISGERTSGFLVALELGEENLYFCNCPIEDNLFSVYNDQPNMLKPSTSRVVNACIKPFNVNIAQVPRLDYKFFWGHNGNYEFYYGHGSTATSDEDIVASVYAHQLSSPRYRRMLFNFTGPHPNNPQSANMNLMKFSTAFSPDYRRTTTGIPSGTSVNLFTTFNILSARTQGPCFYPGGEGRCITRNHNLCIRRHNNAAVGSAEFFTNYWCFLSRDGNWIKIWHPVRRYRLGEYPLVLRCNVLFAVNRDSRDYTTINIVFGYDTTLDHMGYYKFLPEILETFANYSIN
ncbi:agip43 [Agrotis ipsilon multiple nucleopolyhedrovirus]|uniref:Per os infectivity factor-1 n=1 Tax=Agrotis ipsilon multiple nucleopolyhedrovirus TaxID=208013 RepID=B6D5V7_9ABAC|nr:agip43 [Agrotis ipsilon multiple nucleopolyhedrovirus]ACI28745.1 per os infectivity factor-1 [Agrotis ipsilon multiple nucleopolyhedrovirus]